MVKLKVGKIAVITLRLVSEANLETNKSLAQDIRRALKPGTPDSMAYDLPWLRRVLKVEVKSVAKKD